MRTIKFRAWNKDHSIMVHAGDYNDEFISFEGRAIDVDMFSSGTSTLNYQLMQFTGLTDKNDVEIYEGDIVRFCVFDGLAQLEGDSPVYFKDGAFRLNRFHPLNDYIRSGTVEVVGNIYEEESE